MQLTATANSRDAMPNFLTMDFTTVTVQVEETKFVAQKSLLTAVSPYFEKAFNGPFQEAEHQAITLEGISKGSSDFLALGLRTQPAIRHAINGT